MRLLMSFGEVGKIVLIGFVIATIVIGLLFFTRVIESFLWAMFFLLLALAVVLIVIERFSGWT